MLFRSGHADRATCLERAVRLVVGPHGIPEHAVARVEMDRCVDDLAQRHRRVDVVVVPVGEHDGAHFRIFDGLVDFDPKTLELKPGLAKSWKFTDAKTLVLDLATLSGSLPPRLKNLENFEAMSFGPPLADGRRTLLLLSDNNCSDTQVTALVVLAFSAPSTRR